MEDLYSSFFPVCHPTTPCFAPSVSVSFVISNKSFNFSKLELEKWSTMKDDQITLV